MPEKHFPQIPTDACDVNCVCSNSSGLFFCTTTTSLISSSGFHSLHLLHLNFPLNSKGFSFSISFYLPPSLNEKQRSCKSRLIKRIFKIGAKSPPESCGSHTFIGFIRMHLSRNLQFCEEHSTFNLIAIFNYSPAIPTTICCGVEAFKVVFAGKFRLSTTKF